MKVLVPELKATPGGPDFLGTVSLALSVCVPTICPPGPNSQGTSPRCPFLPEPNLFTGSEIPRVVRERPWLLSPSGFFNSFVSVY